MRPALAIVGAAFLAAAGLAAWVLLFQDDLGDLQRQCARTADAVQAELGVRAGLRCSLKETGASRLELVHVQVTLHEVPKTIPSEEVRPQTEAVIRRAMRNVGSIGFDLRPLDGPAP